MSLYIENAVHFPESGSISVNAVWHPNAPLLAAASFSPEKGGFVIIFDDLGEPIKDINCPVHRSYQVTALVWHPGRSILISGWENGDLKVWNGTEDFVNVVGPHKAPITIMEFSEQGGRLVSCDSTGSVVGWKVDSRGDTNMIFHLDLKESIAHLTFRLTVRNNSDFDVQGLAKAAVNGDEQALDMFSNWRPKTTAKKFHVQDGSDNLSFFIATQACTIYYINSNASCSEVLNTEGVAISHIVYHPSKDEIIIMLEGLTVGYFSVDRQGHLTEMAKVKLSGRIQTRNIGNQGLTWAGNNSLALLTGDLKVRVWELDTNENYILPTTMKLYVHEEKTSSVTEIFTCITYCKLNQTLCAGTNIGRIYFWIKNQDGYKDNAEDSWELSNVSNISGTIKQLKWGSIMMRLPLLSVNCVTSIYIMKEQTICTAFSDKIWVTQKTANQVLIETSKSNQLLDLEAQVSDMAVSEDIVCFSNGRTVTVFNVTWKAHDIHSKSDENFSEFSVTYFNSFQCENEGIEIYQKTLISLNSQKICIYMSNGSCISTISSSNSEGDLIGMSITGNYLTVSTLEGYIKMYDLTESSPKLLTTKNVSDLINDFGEIIQAKTNSKGNKISMTIASSNLVPDGKLYIWDIESDEINLYDFRKYDDIEKFSLDEYFGTDRSLDYDQTKFEILSDISFERICKNRVPLSFYWSQEDTRLLVCNARKIKASVVKKSLEPPRKKEEKMSLVDEEQIIITMFVLPDNSIKIHDIQAVDSDARLLGISIPYIVTLQKLNIVRDIMNDFNGLEDCDRNTKEAVIDFSYNLSLGNMDAAFKSIKLVQSQGVWASLARMCVKTKRLDVAVVCLGHMGNAKAARALRLAINDESLPHEAKVAVLAIHLRMLDEAEQLYHQCERYDLLNKLLRSRNKLKEAHSLAESKDRINLRNTEHYWAKVLEENGDYDEAAKKYEKAATHRYDVPKMLSDHPKKLQLYMSKTKDKEMLKWWGQYIESQGDMNTALKIYANAGDVYSQVRVLCFLGEESRAADLTKANTDKAAFYHMARYYETIGHLGEAVTFYTKATAFANAVRLAKENNLSDELWNLGLIVSNREKIEIAKYFEDQNNLDKAVVLFHRGGMLHKAMELAFKTQQFEILQEIASQLDADSDPVLIDKCAQYFVNNEQFDKAVDLLAIAKKYRDAIELCVAHNVRLTENLAEKLTPEKASIDEELRIEVLHILAESLMIQGDYHLATKKFTQSGDKVKAMKSLLKSGDTDKIVFFAGVSRQREIYIMAANYLQSLDWKNQPDVLRNIITFYSKGKALDLLANFYVACAQVEIDEFQNYEKALGALSEASRCLQRIPSPSTQISRAAEIVQQRLTMVKKFVDIRKLFERGDSQAGMTQCRQLLMLGKQELETSVRRGDVYGLMIHNCVKSGNFTEAKQLVLELKQFLSTEVNQIPLTYYLNKDVLEALARGLEVPLITFIPNIKKMIHQDSNEDTVDEVLE